MARIRFYLLTILVFSLTTSLFGAGPVLQSVTYSPDDNTLHLVFDQEVKSTNVLLGGFSFDDDNQGPAADLAVTGGQVLTTAALSTTLDIDLLYGDIIDSFVGEYYGNTTYLFELWGTHTDQVMRFEALDQGNLELLVAAGSFVNANNELNTAQRVAVTYTASGTHPEIVGAVYDANVNLLSLAFSDVVQFDQIAEDRSQGGGPGNGELQTPIGSNDPGEDRNDNGTLDYEQNIRFMRIGFTGTGGAMTLENLGGVIQVADDDTLDIYLTRNDAKRIETSIGLDEALQLDVQPWAFVDTLYNPNAASDLVVNVIADSVDFVPDSAVYNLSKNEMSLYFPNLMDAGRIVKTTQPAPVYTKIHVSNGTNTYTLSGVEGNPAPIAGTGTSAFKWKLPIVDQAGVEALLGSGTLTLAMDNFAVYDDLGNGNGDASGVSLRVTETVLPNEQPPHLIATTYDMDSHILTLTWDLTLGIGFYQGEALLAYDEEADPVLLEGFHAYDTVADSVVSFGSGQIYFEGSKKNTYVELSETDAIWLETYPNLDALQMEVEGAVFNAFLFLNGNAALTHTDAVPVAVEVLADTTAPALLSSRINVFDRTLELDMDEPVELAGVSSADFSISGIELAGTIEALSGAEYDDALQIALEDGVFEQILALPDSQLTAPELIVADNAMTNISGLSLVADTSISTIGRNFYLRSFEAFAPSPKTHFGILKILGEHCDIYVAEDVWEEKVDMDDLQAVLEAFETRAPNDTTRGIKEMVDGYYGGVLDTDGNGKVIIFLADVLDEYDLGRNDTKDNLFENGYVSMTDTTDVAYSNQADIIYLDVDPQIVGEPPYSEWDESMFNALAYQYALMSAYHNKPDQERWIQFGIALKLQELAVGNVKFFGDGANTSTTADNELTYINASLLKGRNDLYNVYNFFTYLTEKYPGETDPLIIVRDLAQSEAIGIAALDTVLINRANGLSTADAYSNYATACFLDLTQYNPTNTAELDSAAYGGLYSFDALDLNAPPSGKNAGNLPWDAAAGNGAPFAKSVIKPWSFNYYVCRAYFVNLDGDVVLVSPDLSETDTLVFDGYDGIDFRVKKIMLRSSFLEDMTTDFEVVDFELDETMGRGKLPVTTDDHFRFRDTSPDTTTGSQLLALVVAKTDYTQPPVTYDFVITNVVGTPTLGDFYAVQNPDADTYLDLFVVSERPIYGLTGEEGASVQVIGTVDTISVGLSKLHDFGSTASVYAGKYELTEAGSFELLFTGRDQNGVSFTPVSQNISIGMARPTASLWLDLPDDLGFLSVPSGAVSAEHWLVASQRHFKKAQGDLFSTPTLPTGIEAVSEVVSTTPDPLHLGKAAILSINLNQEQLEVADELGLYLRMEDGWHYIGGRVDAASKTLQASVGQLGEFILAKGDHGIPEEDLLLPLTYSLEQNHPNPFNPTTTISYALPEAGRVTIRVYDILGQEIETLVHAEMAAGRYEIEWNPDDGRHGPRSSGVYFYTMECNGFRQVNKMVYTK